MPIDLDMPAPLPDSAKIMILRDAESMMSDGADAKEVVVAAVLDHFADQKAFDIAPQMEQAVAMSMLLFGANSANVLADLRIAFPEITSGFDDQTLNDQIVWNGDVPDWNSTAIVLVRAALKAPAPQAMNRGKFLSKYGIVKSDLDAIVPATMPVSEAGFADAALATHGSPELDADAAKLLALGADPGPMFFDLNAMLGLAPVVAEGVGTAYVPTAPAPAAAPVEVSMTDIRSAFIMYSEALEESDQATADKLGISRQTYYNMRTGKTQKPKCDPIQARKMLADIDVRIGKLMRAAETFKAALKPS